jgi:hypothetical protein
MLRESEQGRKPQRLARIAIPEGNDPPICSIFERLIALSAASKIRGLFDMGSIPAPFTFDEGLTRPLLRFYMQASFGDARQEAPFLVRLLARVAFPLLALLSASGCSTPLTRDAQTFQPETITFATAPAGALPADFFTALTGGGGPVSWVVRDDLSAPGGGKALVQESADDTSYRFPLCVYNNIEARDVSVEVNYKPISGKVDQAGGIVLRYTPENYYIARANALENNVDLFKTVNGKRSKIEEVPCDVALGKWHTLRFSAVGRRLTVIFDGKVIIDRKDRTFSNPGKVGLWTKADSVTAFTNLRIERAPQ